MKNINIMPAHEEVEATGNRVVGVKRLRLVKIVFAVLLGIILMIVFIGYRLVGSIRTGLADSFPLYAEKACESLGVPSVAEQDMVHEVTLFSAQIAKGRVPFFQAFDTLWEFDRGPLFEGMLLIGFKTRFLDSEGSAGSEQLMRQKQIFNFFSQACISGSVSSATMTEFVSLVTELRDVDFSPVHNFANIKKTVCLKTSLPDPALERLSALMSTVVSSPLSAPPNDPIDLKKIFHSFIVEKFGKSVFDKNDF